MTQQEEQLLNGLIDRVNGTQLASKDAEAEALLQRTLGTNPDALYVLCQTVLVQGFAMDKSGRDLAAARAEIDALRHAQQPEKHGSFLGNLFGLGKDDPPQAAQGGSPANYGAPTGYGAPASAPGYAPVANAPAVPQQAFPGQAGASGYPMQPGYGQPGYAQPGYPPSGYPQGTAYGYGGQPGTMGGGGGFLQGAMQTAAGVVAGEFAFRAIEDVFSGFGGHGERGFGGGTEVVNNYYDDRPADSGGGGFGDRLAQADNYDGGVSPDIEDRRGEGRGFFGSGDDSGNDGSNFADDSGNDDAGSYDNGGSDDGGSFDSGDSGGGDSGF